MWDTDHRFIRAIVGIIVVYLTNIGIGYTMAFVSDCKDASVFIVIFGSLWQLLTVLMVIVFLTYLKKD